MLDDIQNEENDKTNPSAVPEQFMRYSCTELNDELVEFARRRLHETEETKQKAMEEVKEFIRNDLDTYLPLEDAMLLSFLRSCRFDVRRTCSMMRKSADFLHAYRDYFDRVDVDGMQRTIEAKVAGFLPYRDAKGCALFYVRTECWNPSELTVEELMFCSVVALHEAVEHPVNQVAGFVIIMDTQNLSIWQVMALSSWLITGVQALQASGPFIAREFHIINTPRIFQTCWSLVYPFISEGMKKRITFYDSSDWESLHRNVPPCLLPEELGGQLGPYSYEHWAPDVALAKKKFYDKFHRLLDTEEID